jgi:hypothetical protein
MIPKLEGPYILLGGSLVPGLCLRRVLYGTCELRKMAGKEPFFEDQSNFDLPSAHSESCLPFISPWSAKKGSFPPA